MDVMQIIKEHDWAPSDRAVAEAAGAEISILRKRVAGLEINVRLLIDDTVMQRDNFDDARATAARYLQRARDAEALVKVLQARLAAEAPASTEAA